MAFPPTTSVPGVNSAKNSAKNLPTPDSNAQLALNDNAGIALLEGNESFWFQPTIDPDRWNQYYPYQLIVVKTITGGYTTDHDWPSFTLPIPPQEMTISMPTAISTSVTMGGGIVEEHNAAPFRTIMFQGTMGVLPLRSSNTTLAPQGLLGGIFAGTIRAATNTVKIAKSVISGSTAQGNIKLVDHPGPLSGYRQIHLLRRFLESYLHAKTTNDGKDLRLALAIWKDQTIYLVTPIEFTTRRSASSPAEYLYTLAFKAWKRISLDPEYTQLDVPAFNPRQPGALNQILNRLSNARRTLASLHDIVNGVYQDADRLIEVVREVSFAMKEMASTVQAAIDLPGNIIKDAEQSFMALEAAGRLPVYASLSGYALDVAHFFSPNHQDVLHAVSQASSTSMKATIGGGDAPATNADPIKKILANPQKAYSFFEQVKVSDLRLPPALTRKVIAERIRVRAFTRSDFEQRRDVVVQAMSDIADTVGAGDVNYNKILNRGNTVSTATPTDDHYDILYALNEIAMTLNYLAASAAIKPVPNAITYIAGLASQSGISFDIPVSKFAVPFPFGSTLERLSTQYLGTPDRWHEIATLNDLRAPYVDEEGFDLGLVSDGRLNLITVSDSSNLYIGQSIWLSASNTTRTNRHIRSIEKVAPYFLVTVDGDQDLDRFTTIGKSVLHAFLPNTVNSQMTIFIPSTQPSNENYFATKSIPGLNIFDNLIKVGGVDLLLTQKGDLAITSDGDCRLAVGLTNIIQRIRTSIGTKQGSFLHHQSFGLPITIGANTADMNASEIASAARNLFKGDPAIQGINSVQVQKNGPVSNITLSVSIAGADQVVPVTVQIQR